MATSEKVTFASLGIPFRLFAAPVDRASEYHGVSRCSLCHQEGRHCFRLDIGCYVVLPCPACGVENGLDADDRKNVLCRSCGANVPFPEIADETLLTCYQCLRQGRAAITANTELGMISWEQTVTGVTHGVPGLECDDFETVVLAEADDDYEEWRGVRLPQEMMWEMLRTPTYSTIQGEHWQFCCRQPMVYVGEWDQSDFTRHAPDGDGWTFFAQIMEDEPRTEKLWVGDVGDIYAIYVFHCPECSKYAAHWDRF